MKKIVFFVNHDMYLYNFRKEIVKKFIELGHKVYVVSPNGEYIKYIMDMGAEFIPIEMNRHGINPFKELFLIRKIKKIFKKIKPDYILTFTIKPNIYGGIVARKLKIPYIANITGLGTAVENKGILQKITVLLYKYAFKDIKRVFFQNNENMQFFIDKKIAIGKHKLLPGSGVNLNEFTPLEYPSDDVIRFAFISRIMKEKGIDQYLEAAQVIKSKYQNVEFHVCGFCEENYQEKLKDFNEKGIIIYHGMVNDIKLILKNIHCVVHPTYYPEGISNVLLESCASCRPIITTDRSGCKEVVDDGKNGFMVPIKNSEKLIEAIEKFMLLNYQEKLNMGKNGRLKVEKYFNRDIVIENYLEMIRNNN